jgi:hypothetical protein
LQHHHPSLRLLPPEGILGRPKVIAQILALRQIDPCAVHGQYPKAVEAVHGAVMLLELLAEYDDQFDPKVHRHPLTRFGEGGFADYRRIGSPRIVLAPFAPSPLFALFLCVVQLGGRLFLVFQ